MKGRYDSENLSKKVMINQARNKSNITYILVYFRRYFAGLKTCHCSLSSYVEANCSNIQIGFKFFLVL